MDIDEALSLLGMARAAWACIVGFRSLPVLMGANRQSSHDQKMRPSWTDDLGAMIAGGCAVRASCDRCSAWRDVDLAALMARVGPRYSLVDRRCRCRLTPGCAGWNRFLYLHGVYRRLWSDAASDRWARIDWYGTDRT